MVFWLVIQLIPMNVIKYTLFNDWLVVWNHGILWLSHHIGNVIIPTDELIFFRGVETKLKRPTSIYIIFIYIGVYWILWVIRQFSVWTFDFRFLNQSGPGLMGMDGPPLRSRSSLAMVDVWLFSNSFFPSILCIYIHILWLVVSNIWIIFHNIWDNPSHWLICFNMVKTTNQILLEFKFQKAGSSCLSNVAREHCLFFVYLCLFVRLFFPRVSHSHVF